MRLALIAVALGAVAAFDVEGGGGRGPPANMPRARQSGPPLAGASGPPRMAVQQQGRVSSGVAEVSAKVSKWYRWYQNFIAAAAKVSQLISFMTGIWLTLSTPFSLLGSVFSMRVQDVVLIIYLGLFGVLMMGIEVPLGAVQRLLRQYFFFVFTRTGRALFVAHVAAVAWVCHHVGFLTKVATLFNAGLTFYILNSQDRRFAASDAEAKAALQSVAEEVRGSAKEALGVGRMFGSFTGFGKGAAASAPDEPAQSAPAGQQMGGMSAGGGFVDSSYGSDDADQGSGWPSSGGGGAGA